MVAPSATFTATSRRRAIARERSRMPALRQALNNTSVVVPRRTALSIAIWCRRPGSRREYRSPVMRRGSSGTETVPRFVSAYRSASEAATASSSA